MPDLASHEEEQPFFGACYSKLSNLLSGWNIRSVIF
jgi:hypothetical protein